MKYLIKLISSLFMLLVMLTNYAQEGPASEWRWDTSQQENVALYIGNDTITQSAPPILDKAQWWTSFGYETLDKLEQKALANNVDLKIAIAKLDQAKAKKDIALTTLFPSLSLEPSINRQEFSANQPNAFGAELRQVTLNTYQAPITLSYELDVFGKNNNIVQANKLVLEANEEYRKQILLEVTTQTANYFFQLVRLDAEIDLLQFTEKTRLDNLEIASSRYQAGLVSQVDEFRAKTELASINAQLKNIHKLRSEIELILITLIGEDVSTFEIPHTNIKYLPPSISSIGKVTLSNSRPDLKASKLMIASSEKLLINQKRQLLPSFHLNGGYGYLSGNSEHLFEGRSRTWFTGITASIPIFEGGKKRAEIKLRRSELDERQRSYEKAELQSHQQVENTFSNLYWLREQLLAQQQFVVAARDVSELTKERYRKGLVNYFNVVDAERQVLEAQRLSVQLFGQELTERVNLIRYMALYPQLEKE